MEDEMTAAMSEGLRELAPGEVKALLDAGKVLLVDVREPDEYAAERIPGAVLYPLSTFDSTALPPDESRGVVFHCGSGKRSMLAAHQRKEGGYPEVTHMKGGIAAWKAAGLPLIRLDPVTGKPTRM
jgi:rhodanese-related sulfurtransferase